MICRLCPRMCSADRANGQTGYCGMPEEIYAARAALHMWEEPCLSGEEGSGTVFFSGCSLRCVFCQNHFIADGSIGKKISVERLAEIFLELQEKKANNINLVTPTHYIEPIKKALDISRQAGLTIPIVYNTSGYETVEAIRGLEGYIDIYLPDLKYKSEILSLRYSKAADYFKRASAALEEMVRQKKEAVYDSRGIMKQGVIVRHLMLPGCIEDSKAVIQYLYTTYRDSVVISIMNQYTPLPLAADIPELNRKVTAEEYEELVDYAISLGVENGYIQEGDTAEESFIPAFDLEGIDPVKR